MELTLWSLNLPLSFSSTTSREVGDKWKNMLFFLKHFHEIFFLKPLGFSKLGYFSVMRNIALMRREGLKG